MLKQQANSQGGSGLVQATVSYAGSVADGHIWRAVAKVGGKKIYDEQSYKTPFIGAKDAAQRFADHVYDEVYVEHREPTDREEEADLAHLEELFAEFAA